MDPVRFSYPRSKTDQEAEGREVYLQKRTIKAIEKYQRLSGVSEGPLFRRIYQNCKMGNDAQSVLPQYEGYDQGCCTAKPR